MVYKTSLGDNYVSIGHTPDALDPYELSARLCSIESGMARSDYTEYLRVSALSSICPREYVLGYRHGLSTLSSVNPSLAMTFEIGNAVHERMQNYENYFGSRLLGNWRCVACGAKMTGSRPKTRCPVCNAYSSSFVYEEVSIRVDAPYKITGHIDVLLPIDGCVRVVDIKTISGRGFAGLDDMPLAGHAAQVLGYMRLSKYSNPPTKFDIDRNIGYVLYVCKEHSGRSYPMKAYRVMYRDYIDMWDELKTRMRLHAEGIMDPSKLPDALKECVASRFSSYRARSCPALDICRRELG